MNYIELLNRFWQEVEMKDLNPFDGYLYLALVHECNRRGWQNPFSLSNKKLMLLLGISKSGIQDGRSRLRDRGLIDFVNGNRKAEAPQYYICEELGATFWDVETPKTPPNGSQKAAKTPPKSSPYNKLKTKTETIESPNGDNASPPEETVLPLDFGDKKKRKRTSTPKDPPAPFPTIDEVMQYFLTQDADKRLQDWELVARQFFDNYNGVGWRDKYNRRITNWDSVANSWIFREEKRQKTQPRTHETDKTDRFQQRRGTLPTAQSGEDYSDSL